MQLAIRIPRIRTNAYGSAQTALGRNKPGGKQQSLFACHEISLHLEGLAPQGFELPRDVSEYWKLAGMP